MVEAPASAAFLQSKETFAAANPLEVIKPRHELAGPSKLIDIDRLVLTAVSFTGIDCPKS
jgi:hypothetical protein